MTSATIDRLNYEELEIKLHVMRPMFTNAPVLSVCFLILIVAVLVNIGIWNKCSFCIE